MMDAETRRFIQEEISRKLNIILSGTTGTASTFKENIEELFPGMPTLEDRPVVQPFGLSSVAPAGTLNVNARMGEHFGSRYVMGHMDSKKTVVMVGETALYDAYGGTVLMKQPGFEVIKNGVGLLDQLIKLVRTIINARTNTMLGPQPLIPNPQSQGGLDGSELFITILQKLEEMRGGVSGP